MSRIMLRNGIEDDLPKRCGFVITGEDSGFSNARGEEVEEFILTLN